MSQEVDQLGRAIARAAGMAALGTSVRVSAFASVSDVEAVVRGIDQAGGLASLPRSAIGTNAGELYFMLDYSDLDGDDVLE